MPKIAKRIIAFILDMFLVGLLSTLLSICPLNVNYDKEVDLSTEYQEKLDAWIEKTEGLDEDTEEYETAYQEYIDISEDYVYESNRLSWIENIVMVFIIILYYAILPIFMGGSTLGKRIMKLSVESSDGGTPKLSQMLLRTIVLFEVPFTILSVILVFILNKTTFTLVLSIMNILSYILLIAIGATTLFRSDNRGLHDMLAKTSVEERK